MEETQSFSWEMQALKPFSNRPSKRPSPSLPLSLRKTNEDTYFECLSNVTKEAVESVRVATNCRVKKSNAKSHPVLQLQERLERLERDFETHKLSLYKQAFQSTKQASSERDVKHIRNRIKKKEQDLVNEFNEKTENVFEKQKKEVLQLITRCNNNELQAQATLQTLEHQITLRDASTSKLNINKSRVRLYAAVLHKRLAWIQRKIEVTDRINSMSRLNLQQWEVGRELSKIKATLEGQDGALNRNALVEKIDTLNKNRFFQDHPEKSATLFYAYSQIQAYDKELGALPSLAYLTDLHDEIKKGLNDTNQVCLSYIHATTLSKQYALQLDWGRDHLLTALHSPANWTITRRLALLRSKAGNYHAFATEIEPLSHVPSGSREKLNGRTQPTNFQRTTFYRVGAEETHRSYRGGQFPTVEAAKKATQMMIDDGASDIHINSLLTPTALPGKKDRTLLKTHYENIERALAGSTTSFSLTNFGVNEGAQGQLGPEIAKKLGLHGPRIDTALQGGGLGWHYATRKFNNNGMEALNTKLEHTLRSLKQAKQNLTEEAKRQRLLHYYPHIIEVAKEIQHLWKTNAFANSATGNDPFKMPALLKVMDMMLGTTSYVNCMSGKDRTGETEAAAHLRFAEIEMAIAERAPQNNSNIDSVDINKDLIKLGYSLHNNNRNKEKLNWISKKQVSSFSNSFLLGTVGVEAHSNKTAPALTHNYHSANRRNMMAGSGAAAITLQNTAYAGSKVGGGAPLLIYGAGFDIDAILREYKPENYNLVHLYNEVGLSRLSEDARKELYLPPRAPSPKQLSRWLLKVAEHQRKIFKPTAKVKH